MTDLSHLIEVENGLEQLEHVQVEIDAFVARHGLPASVRHALLLVVEELFVNTVSYGYDDSESDMIAIDLKLLDDGDVRLTMRDQARPFDASRPANPPEEASLEEMKIGGLGLFLVHELARDISYERRDNSNITALVLGRD